MLPKSDNKKEIYSLTIFRGLAALLVVFYHIKDRVKVYFPEFINEVVSRGYLAVDFFFILSGFVLALSYGEFFTGNNNRFLVFFVKRIARLYPLHLFILFLYLIVPLILFLSNREVSSLQYDFSLLFANVLLVQNWGWGDSLSWNIPAWSISTEMFAYLLFPLFLFMLRSIKKYFLIIPFLISYAAILFTYIGQGYTTIDADIPSLGVFRCVFEFFIGVCLYYIYKQFGIASAFSITAFSVIITLVSVNQYSSYREVILIPLFFSAVILFSVWLEIRFDFSRFSVLVWLGKISYSVYLCHYLIRDLFKFILPEGQAPLWWVASYLTIVLVCAHYLYRGIESKSKNVESILFSFLSKFNVNLMK